MEGLEGFFSLAKPERYKEFDSTGLILHVFSLSSHGGGNSGANGGRDCTEQGWRRQCFHATVSRSDWTGGKVRK